jgi:adenylate kinase
VNAGARPRVGIVLLGPPGSGKGVQGRLLAERYGIAHLSTGELLRAGSHGRTPQGNEVADAMLAGRLVPDELVAELLAEAVAGLPPTSFGVVLDGYPRTVAQAARLLDGSIDVRHVIELHCPPAELQLRLSNRLACDRCGGTTFGPRCPRCGTPTHARVDDRPAVAERRLHDYHSQIADVLELFRARELLRIVNGLGSTQEVSRRIRAWVHRDLARVDHPV